MRGNLNTDWMDNGINATFLNYHNGIVALFFKESLVFSAMYQNIYRKIDMMSGT